MPTNSLASPLWTLLTGSALAATFATILAPGCQSTQTTDAVGKGTLTVVAPVTVLPQAQAWREKPTLPTKLTIPAQLVQHYYVARAHSPLRKGPGIHFPIHGKLLDYGEHAILLGKQAVWRKAFFPKSQKIGWLHAKALLPKADTINTLTLPTAALTLLHTKKRVLSLEAYPEKNKMKANIPAGTALIHLQSIERSVLVWIPQSNAVAWLALPDLH